MKKKLLFFIIIVLASLILIVLYILLSSTKGGVTTNPGQLLTPTPIFPNSRNTNTNPTSSPTVLQNIPGKISISGVYVKDFSNNPSDPNGNAIIQGNNNFTILYISNENKFSIIINTAPFTPTRQLAEQAFLKDLDITQEEACNLYVIISSPSRINPDVTGQTFGLSFCGQ